MQEVRLKLEGVITGYLRHFAFSRVFISSEGKFKTPVKSETELFVALANGRRQLDHVTWISIQDIMEFQDTPHNCQRLISSF